MPRSFADSGGAGGGGGSSTFLGLTDTMSSFTDGSVLFTSSSAVTEDNDGLNWDNSGKKLTVSSGDSTVTPSTDADELVVEGTGQTGIHIINSGSSKRIRFGDTTDSSRAIISCDSDDITIGPTNLSGVLKFGTGAGAAEKARIDSSGNLGIGQTSPDHRLHLKMDGTLNQDVMDVEGSTGGRLFRINTDANGHTDVGIYNASGQRKIKFGTGPNENAYFTDTEVGIGNSSPTGLLDVGSGDSTEEFFLPAPSAAPADGDLANSQWTLYLDEGNDDIIVKAKESGGTVITKTLGGGGSGATHDTNKFTATSTWAARDSLGATETDTVTMDAVSMTGGELELQVDGTKHSSVASGSSNSFVVEATSDVDVIAQDRLYAFDVASYDSKSISVTSQESSPAGISFKSDGTKMYVVGFGGDAVDQYSLSTAWDVSTATYDSVTFSVSSQDTLPIGMYIKDDGTKFYIMGRTNNTVFQYSMSTAWDLSTSSYDSKSFSAASQETTTNNVAFNSDGTNMYIVGEVGDDVNVYDLSTAWDVSTATFDQAYSLTDMANPTGIFFGESGKQLLISGYTNDNVLQYDLSTAYDVSTASTNPSSLSVAGQDGTPRGIYWGDSGAALYVMGNSTDTVYQYLTKTTFGGTGNASIIY